MRRKGIILAGGSGTRLHPLTLATSKQLLPVYDKPMIYYPLATLMLAGIRDILIITTPEDQAAFKRLLQDGSQWGVKISFEVQEEPNGLAQAFVIGERFLDGHPSCLVLGDNLIYGHGLTESLARVSERETGASVFAYRVEDPERYGVVAFGEDGMATSIVEKPTRPISPWAVIGLYFYDGRASEFARKLKPSSRGEYEITDLNNVYLQQGELHVEKLGRGFAWFDTGTHDALIEAGAFVKTLQSRQGQIISSPEEVAFGRGWISAESFLAQGKALEKSRYGRALLQSGEFG